MKVIKKLLILFISLAIFSSATFSVFAKEEIFTDNEGIIKSFDTENSQIIEDSDDDLAQALELEDGTASIQALPNSGIKQAYINLVDSALKSYSYIYTNVYDMNSDGTPELILTKGTAEYNLTFYFYTYTGSGTKSLGTFHAGHTGLYRRNGVTSGNLIAIYSQMDYTQAFYLNYNGGSVTNSRFYEGHANNFSMSGYTALPYNVNRDYTLINQIQTQNSTSTNNKVTGITVTNTSGKSVSSFSLNKDATTDLLINLTPTTASNRSINYSFENEGIAGLALINYAKGGKATVRVKGLKVGTTKLTFASDATPSVKKVISITVKDNSNNSSSSTVFFKSITLDKTSVTLKAPNGTTKLYATTKPVGSPATSLKWTSSNSSIVTVESDGRIRAKKQGNATITVTATNPDGSKVQASCLVTVTSTNTSSSDPWGENGIIEKNIISLGNTKFTSGGGFFAVASIDGMKNDEKAAVMAVAELWKPAISSDLNQSFSSFKVKKAAIKMNVKINGKSREAYLVHWESGIAGQSTGSTYFVLNPGKSNQRQFLMNVNATASTKTFGQNMQKYLVDSAKKDFYKWCTGQALKGVITDSTMRSLVTKYLNKGISLMKGSSTTSKDAYQIKGQLNNYVKVISSGTVSTYSINTNKLT